MKKLQYLNVLIIILLWAVSCTPEDSSSPEPEDTFVKYFSLGGAESVVDIQPYGEGYLVLGSTDLESTFFLVYTDHLGNEIGRESVVGFDVTERVFTVVEGTNEPTITTAPKRMLVHGDGSEGSLITLVGTTTIRLFSDVNFSINRLAVANTRWNGSGFDDPVERVFPSFRDIDFDNANVQDTLSYLARFNSEGADLVRQGSDLIILGSTEDVSDKGLITGDDPKDMWLIRVADDLAGDIVWQRKYGFEGEDTGIAIESNNAGYSIVGSTELRVNGLGGLNVLYYPTDFDGFVLDNQSFGTAGDDVPTDILVVNGTTPVVLGTTNNETSFMLSATPGGFQSRITNIDLGSSPDADSPEPRFTGNLALRFTQLQSGDFFVVGQLLEYTANGTNKNGEIVLYQTNQFGIVDENSVQVFGGIGSDMASAVIENSDRTLMIGGTTDFQGGISLMTLMKTDSRGRLQR